MYTVIGFRNTCSFIFTMYFDHFHFQSFLLNPPLLNPPPTFPASFLFPDIYTTTLCYVCIYLYI